MPAKKNQTMVRGTAGVWAEGLERRRLLSDTLGTMTNDGSVTCDDYLVLDANRGLGVGSPLNPVSVTVHKGICKITGSSGGDRITIKAVRDAGTGKAHYAVDRGYDVQDLTGKNIRAFKIDAGDADDTVIFDLGKQSRYRSLKTTIHGGAGNDSILGSPGADRIYGGDGDDTINGAAGRDRIDGQAGADVLIGGKNNDSISGASGNDSIYGGDGDDMLAGNKGNDRVEGGKGYDWLDGGAGANVLIGGKENNHYTFTKQDKTDIAQSGAPSTGGGTYPGTILAVFDNSLIGGTGRPTGSGHTDGPVTADDYLVLDQS